MRQLPIALTIAGSDSGGGAGIQADLKTFARIGVHGASAITCLTAQNPKEVRAIQPAKPEIVRQQIAAVLDELPPAAAKTGMLFSADIIQVVIEAFAANRQIPLVVDPVMISTSGARLLRPNAITLLKKKLLPLATIVTPNVDEAEVLVDEKIRTVEDLRSAAHRIFREFGCAALVKGGHLRGLAEAADIFYDGKSELLLTAPFVKGVSTHGTGCTYSAAIAGYLARGLALPKAVSEAKTFISQSIAQSVKAGRHFVLNTVWS